MFSREHKRTTTIARRSMLEKEPGAAALDEPPVARRWRAPAALLMRFRIAIG
jgi:hypothetical protein